MNPGSPTPAPQADAAHPAWHFYRIANMDCASEESEIRQALADVEGIHRLQFRLGARVLGIAADEAALPRVVAAIRRCGFKPEPLAMPDHPPAASPVPGNASCGCGASCAGAAASAASAAPGPLPSADAFALPAESFWQRWGRLLLALVLATGSELLGFVSGVSAHDAHPDHGFTVGALAGMVLAAAAIWLAGFSVYGKGLAALRRGRLNINALMTVAVTGAFLIGQWPEAAMVMALYALAEAIEARAVDRARHAIGSLLALTPDEAEIRQADGRWQRVPVAGVAVGAVVRVRPGQRVPLDGVVRAGQGAIDQSPITGESLPVDKAVGDSVFAGTINQGSLLEIEVMAPAGESTLARIIRAVEQAQASRAPTQRLVDRFAGRYTPAVFVLAVAVAVLLPWLTDASGWQALYQALVLLVIACPCALVISTPVTVVSALAAAARRGVLIKGGGYLEEARRLRVVALDKTGTLTEGRPELVAFEARVSDVDEQHLRQWALALASPSDHPVSRAIVAGLHPAAAQEAPAVADFQAQPGRGVQGRIVRQPAVPVTETLVLANHRWIEERGQCDPALEARLQLHERAGRTVTLLADGQRVLALLAVADTLRPQAAEAVAALRAQGIVPVMLTGDNEATARSIATQAGIDEVLAGLLPEDKLQAIARLQQRHGRVAMVGDGINDAPALARADLGVAMGAAGTDTAIEAADVLIMNDDLRRLPATIALSARVHRVLWQNIVLALGIKLVFLLLAIAGLATMWMAVFADMGASLLVVANGLRLLRGTAVNGS
ncbi:MAG: heavy metal translocating P-type ATPase [Lautropia sp.]|nr:heavy metal translocating P-type ATPase [Lautropia sp.]